MLLRGFFYVLNLGAAGLLGMTEYPELDLSMVANTTQGFSESGLIDPVDNSDGKRPELFYRRVRADLCQQQLALAL